MPTPTWHFPTGSKDWALRLSESRPRACLEQPLGQQPYSFHCRRKSHSSSPQSVLWNRPQPSEDRLPSHQGLIEAKSSSSSSSNHSDNFFRIGSSPLEVPKAR